MESESTSANTSQQPVYQENGSWLGSMHDINFGILLEDACMDVVRNLETIHSGEGIGDTVTDQTITYPPVEMSYDFEPLLDLDELITDCIDENMIHGREIDPMLMKTSDEPSIELHWNDRSNNDSRESKENDSQLCNVYCSDTPQKQAAIDHAKTNNPDGTSCDDDPNIIGLDSKQMHRVQQMMDFLKESKLERDRQLLKIFQEVSSNCIEFHLAGYVEYQHLPGSIFQALVSRVDSADFLRVFQAVKNHPSQRVTDPTKQA
jgi:hypothetical protein